MIRIIAITKQTIFLEKAGLLFRPANMQVIAVALTPLQGVKLLQSMECDVVLIDLHWPTANEVPAFRSLVNFINSGGAKCRIIAISNFYSQTDQEEIASLGVQGYFYRTVPNAASALLDSIRGVHAGKICYPVPSSS